MLPIFAISFVFHVIIIIIIGIISFIIFLLLGDIWCQCMVLKYSRTFFFVSEHIFLDYVIWSCGVNKLFFIKCKPLGILLIA